MKKFLSVLLTCVLMVSCCAVLASAEEKQDILLSRTVELLDNGDSIVIELYENAIQPRTGKTGYKTYTYRNSAGKNIWAVTVTGSFSYTYGASSTATGSTATVNIYDSNAKFVSKNAYTSGSTATATGTVSYNASVITRSVSVSCDKYGNLS